MIALISLLFMLAIVNKGLLYVF